MILSEQQIEEIRSHMLHQEEALKTKFKARDDSFVRIKVLHNEVEDYEAKGYIAQNRTARKTTMVKPKEHSIQLEDDIWCMFYRLGFRILNLDENLRVQWGVNKTDTHQLDVVAVGEDAIFVVECKSAATPQSRSFKNELNAMEQYMAGVSETLRQVYGKEKRVKFIFATRNFRFQEEGEDIMRMRNAGIFHLNENAFSYIKNLTKSYKEAVIYQFHALMFKDELVSSNSIIIPAMRGYMGGKKYYLFSVEPSTLLKIGFVLHRTRVNDSMAPTYQRLLVPSRLKGITKFIDNGGYFPNSIIINFCEPNENLKIDFAPVQEKTDSSVEFGYLEIPNAYGIAHIIDGQHRIYGYANSQYKDKNTIPVVAFENMESEEQLKIFMEINENQKSVSPSLRLDLEEDLYWNSGRLDSRMKALRSSIIKALSASSNNILYNKISIGEDSASLTFKPFDTALAHSGLIPKANMTQWTGDLDICMYNTNETDSDKAMKDSRKRITQFIDGVYAIIDEQLKEEYKSDFLFSNRATYAIIALLGSIHAYLIKCGIITHSSSVSERLQAIRPYIEALTKGLNNISDEEKTSIKGFLGQGADSFWLHSFQNMVNKKFPDYCPDELTIFKETQDQNLQKQGQEHKAEIKELLRQVFFSKIQGVHGMAADKKLYDLKNECEGRIIKAHADDEDFDIDAEDWRDWIEVSEYKKKIEDNFVAPEFEEAFAINLGGAFKSRKDKLAWMLMIEEPKGKKKSAITKSDLSKLWIIRDHLAQFKI